MFEEFTEEIRKVPMVRVFFPFLAGIVSSRLISLNFSFLFFLYLFLFALFLYMWLKKNISYKYNLRWVFGLTANGILILTGFLYLTVFESRPYLQGIEEDTDWLLADVVEIPEEREKTFKIVLIARAGISANTISPTHGKLLAYIRKDSLSEGIRQGHRLLLENNFNEITNSNNPCEFDYKRYLWNQGIRRQGFFRTEQWTLVDSGRGNPILLFAGNLRQNLLSVFRQHGLSGDEYAVASALTLGYKAALDEDIRRSYSSSGAMHVLAVSGLHVGIIYFVLNYLLRFFNRFKWGVVFRAVILILCLWFYAVLTGLSPSVMRAATMFSFIIISSSLKRPANIYNTLSASALFLIIINPNIIWAVGFQLSYLAVLGIVFFQPRIYRLIYVKNSLLDKLWALTCVSIGAQIGTFPLSLYYFNQFPNLFFVTNLFVIPLATLILYSGILLFIFSFYSTLSALLAFVLKWLVWTLNASVRVIESIPFSHSRDIYIYFEQIPLFYLLVILITFLLIRRHNVFFRLSLLVILILIGFWSYGSITAKRSNQLIIYNQSNRIAINYLNQHHNILLTDDASTDTKKQLAYLAKGVWTRYKSPMPHYYSVTDSFPGIDSEKLFGHRHFWSFDGKNIVIADASLLRLMQTFEPIEIDLLVLTGRQYTSVERLVGLFNPGQIIIAPTVPFWLRERYEKELGTLEQACHNIPSQGAFMMSLN